MFLVLTIKSRLDTTIRQPDFLNGSYNRTKMKKSFIIPFGLTPNEQALFVAETIFRNSHIKEFEFYTGFNTPEEGAPEHLLNQSVPVFVDDYSFPGVKLTITSSAKKAKRYFGNLMLQ